MLQLFLLHRIIFANNFEGKSTERLNNLRTITLTNCDVKIITRSFANRMSKLMPEVILLELWYLPTIPLLGRGIPPKECIKGLIRIVLKK